MIRIFVFFMLFVRFGFSLEVHEALFPNGESFKDIIVNEAIGKKVLFSDRKKISFINKDWSDFRINLIDIDKKKIFFQLNDGFINNIAMAKDSSYIAYEINVDYVKPIILKIFDIKTKKIIQTFPLENKLKSLVISPNGKYIVCLSEDNKILSFSLDEKKLKFVFSLPNIKDIEISVSNNYIAIKKNKFISLHTIKTGQEIKSFNIEYDYFSKIDISSDDKYLLFSDFRSIKIWDIKSQNIISKLIINGITEVKFLNDSSKIIYMDKDVLNVFNLKKKKNIFSIQHTKFKTISLLKDDNRVLINSQFLVDLKIFKIESLIDNLNCIKPLKKKKACLLENSKMVFSMDEGKGIKVWNLKKNKLEYIIDKKYKINDMLLEKNEKYLIFVSNRSLKVWDVEEKEVRNKYQEKNSIIQDLSISDSGKLIAFKVDNKIKIIDFKSLKLIQEIEYPFEISQFRFIEDKYLILGKYEKIDIFDIGSAQKVNTIHKRRSLISLYKNSKYCQVFTYSNNSEEEKREIRETLTNKVILSTFPKNEYIYSIEDNNIYTYCEDTNKSYIWDLKEKKKIREIKDKSFSATNDRISIIIHDGDEKEIKKIFYNNDYWAIIDYQTKKIYRYSDKNFILDTKTYQPLLPKLQEVSKDDIEIFFETKNIKLINNEDSIFNIQVKNLSNHKLYWIEPIIDDENFTIKTNSIVVLEPNEIKSVQVPISYNKFIKQSFSKNLTIKVTTVKDIIKEKNFKVEIEKRLDIEIDKIKLEDEGISIKFKKNIDNNLTNVKVTLSEGNKSVENNNLYTHYIAPIIETNNSIKVYLPSQGIFGYTFGKGHDFTVTINANEISSYTFKKYVKFDIPTTLLLILLIPIFLLIIAPYFIYLGLFNRNIQRIALNPKFIFDSNLKKLPHYKKVLKRSLKKEYFERCFIEDFDKVVKFFEIDNEEKANIFAQRSNGELHKLDNDFFEITLSENFELSIESFLLYFSISTDINSIFNILKNRESADIIIVIGQTEEEQKLINESNKLHELSYVLGISPKNLKLFLLKKEHTKTLAQIFATRLDRTLLSPYQEKGQLINESYFFGRKKIIKHIYNRELSNYFIVGARQIGKSSLLRALELKFKTRDDVVCFSFEDTLYLLKDIARALKIDKKSSLEDIYFFISNSSTQYIFLIDEVDEFIIKEKNSGYKILQVFRSLTQKRKAYFIMAGYYELFAQISFDYHSPIKNFGETIRLGKLEGDACAKLIVEPMENLGLYYQDVKAGAEIIFQTGQRANLIAMVCADIIKNLKPFTNEIRRSDIDSALQCMKVRNTHYEWNNTLYRNEKQSYITQIIVYASIRMDYFTLKQITESLQQLELMYIIEKIENAYKYTIPLMRDELKKEDGVMLERVIREFRQKYS